jgi:protein-S-isoprenylcysteine O-methyltransferase Ste14
MALVLLATIADAAGAPTLSFYFLLASVPAIVVAGLAALEELVHGALPNRRIVGLLHVVTLVLVLVSAALRAPMRAEGTVPTAAISAAIACLVVFGLQALISSLPALKRALRPQSAPSELPLS